MNESDHNLNPSHKKRIKIVKPTAEFGENDHLWQLVRKYQRLMPSAPNPNLGRVEELKEEISKGNYITSEVLDETAARLTMRFTRPE